MLRKLFCRPFHPLRKSKKKDSFQPLDDENPVAKEDFVTKPQSTPAPTSSPTSPPLPPIDVPSTPIARSSICSSLVTSSTDYTPAPAHSESSLSTSLNSSHTHDSKSSFVVSSSSTEPPALPMDLKLHQVHPDTFYERGKKLGSGGFAEVYIVKHKQKGEQGAMKLIRKQSLVGSEIYLLREIQNLALLSHHPNIAGLISSDALFETEEAFYLILELCEGGEVFTSIVEDGWYDESDAVHLVRQILLAIDYCHAYNIVHRDLKPENLLLKHKNKSRNENTLMVADFGLSNSIESEGQLFNTQCGTKAYLSPEIMKRTGYGKPADMWSIGCITYVLLCGYLPFDVECKESVLTGSFRFYDEEWSNISNQAKDFIRQLLIVDPQRRMTAAQALQHPWMNQGGKLPSKVNLASTLRRGSEIRRFKNAVEKVIDLNRLGKIDHLLKPSSDSPD